MEKFGRKAEEYQETEGISVADKQMDEKLQVGGRQKGRYGNLRKDMEKELAIT